MVFLEFLPEEDSKEVTVLITDDNIEESVETFTALLESDQPNVIVDADARSASITILDEDRESFISILCTAIIHMPYRYVYRCHYWF